MTAPPLTTSAHDVTGLDGFMLNTDLLMASELWALATGDEFKAAVGLWCRAWKQTPPGSLPDDDRVLAAFSGAGKAWPKLKGMALRGFVKCSDGRLYHSTLCEDAVRASAAKAERAARTKAATEARKNKRHVERHVERDDTKKPDVTKSHRRDETRKEEDEIGNAGARDASRETEIPHTDQFSVLEKLLREAAGWEREPHPNLMIVGPAAAAIAGGVDLDLDLLPAARAHGPKLRNRTSWNYIIQCAITNRNQRLDAAADAASDLSIPPFLDRRNAHSKQKSPTQSNLYSEALGRITDAAFAGVEGEA